MHSGDRIWDFIAELVDEQKEEEQVRREIVEMLDEMMERRQKELKWLKKIKRMMEFYYKGE